jgi:hypothetical protein
MKTRPLEMAAAFNNGTWRPCIFIDVPADTLDDKLEEVGTEIVNAQPRVEGLEIVHVWVYNSQEDEIPEPDVEIPDCPKCSGQMELSGLSGVGKYSCYSCGYTGPG